MIGRALMRGATELRDIVSTLDAPAEWLTDAMRGGRKTHSGVHVDEQSALRLAAVDACVRVVSESVAGLPCVIYERTGPKSRERADSHPYAAALRVSPNPYMTAIEYWEQMTAYPMLHGRGEAYIDRQPNGSVAMWPLPPSRTTWVRDYLVPRDGSIAAGAPTGVNVTLDSGEVRYIPRADLVSMRAFGYAAKSPIQRHRETIGLGLAAEEYGARFFGQGGSAGGFISMDPEATGEQADRTEARYRARNEGLERAHLVSILEGGARWQEVGIPMRDAQYIDGRQFTVEEICRIFRVPPHKVQHLLRSTFSNIEHQAIEFVVDSLGPWITRHEQAMRAYLFGTQRYGMIGDRWAEFLVENLLRGDIETRYKAYSVAIQYGFMSRNQVRELENWAQADGLDDFLYPLNLGIVGAELDPQGQETKSLLKLGAILSRSLQGPDFDVDVAVDRALRPGATLPSPAA